MELSDSDSDTTSTFERILRTVMEKNREKEKDLSLEFYS